MPDVSRSRIPAPLTHTQSQGDEMNWYRTLLQVARKMETPQLERLVTDPDVSPTGRAALQLALDERRVARVASESIATMRSQA